MLVTILGNVDGITLRLDIGTNMGFLDGSFDGSKERKLEGFLIGDSMRSNDGKVIGYKDGTAQAGLTWSGVHVMVVGWMFGGIG